MSGDKIKVSFYLSKKYHVLLKKISEKTTRSMREICKTATEEEIETFCKILNIK